jgi:predicted dehydrogenase
MKNDNILSLILIGCGAVSKFHYAPAIKAIAKKEKINVGALVDPDPGNLLSIAKLFPAAKAVKKLSDTRIDEKCLAIIASPPAFHKEQTLYCINRGASVLCEKPMAASVAEAETMVQCANKEGKALAIGLFRRFFPSSRTAQELIQGNALGKLVHFSIEEGEKFSWAAASDSLFIKSSTPGGVLYDIGVHVLDLLTWWLGDPNAVDYRDDAMGGLEANCSIRFAYPSGIGGTVRLSRDWKLKNCYTLEFEKGYLSWAAGQANRLSVTLNSTSELINGELHNFRKADNNIYIQDTLPGVPQSIIAQLTNVIHAARGEERLFIPAEEGIRSMRLIERCYKKRGLMFMPWLSEEEAKKAELLSRARSGG